MRFSVYNSIWVILESVVFCFWICKAGSRTALVKEGWRDGMHLFLNIVFGSVLGRFNEEMGIGVETKILPQSIYPLWGRDTIPIDGVDGEAPKSWRKGIHSVQWAALRYYGRWVLQLLWCTVGTLSLFQWFNTARFKQLYCASWLEETEGCPLNHYYEVGSKHPKETIYSLGRFSLFSV